MELVPIVDGKPVYLPGHDHPEFGTPGLHYHIDWHYMRGPAQQDKVVRGEVTYEFREKFHETYELEVSAFNLIYFLSKKIKGKACEGLCPHKGLPVIDGQCTGHGLCFDEHNNIIDKFQIVAFGSVVEFYGQGSYKFQVKEPTQQTIKLLVNGRVRGKIELENQISNIAPTDTVNLTLFW